MHYLETEKGKIVSSEKVISMRRQAANRANAQKSTGPKSPEGKARAAANAVRHGLAASNFVILTEDVGQFNGFRQSYMDRFGPRDGVEVDLIDRMVHAAWTERRTWSMENDAIDLQVRRMAPALAAEIGGATNGDRAARAIEELAKQPTLALLHRYAARLSNEFQRALKTLLELREKVPLIPAGTSVAQASACEDPPPCETNPIPPSDTVAQASACGSVVAQASACGSVVAQASACGSTGLPTPLTTNHQPLTTSPSLATSPEEVIQQ
jgi:hypothetical protein